MYRRLLLSTLLISVACIPTVAEAQKGKDVRGSRDHPVIGARYPGSKIVRYSTKKFDEFTLLLGPVKGRGKPGEHKKLEGKVSRASYEIARGRTTLEVFRNYEMLLKKKGFQPMFTCTNKDCGGRGFNHTVVPYWSGFSENYGDQRYLALRKEGPKGDIYVSLYVVRNHSVGGPTQNRIYAQVDVVEIARMDVGMEVVDASKMKKSIDAHGHIALYGIMFDTDSAKIRARSTAALAEIAKLLKAQPSLKLFVVGHTDNQGKLDYNLKLSSRRAEAVVKDLVAKHGIDRARLAPHGLGFLAPVASNRGDEGRQKNRRVELVER